MYQPTSFEQEMLELVNRARLDPQGEYDALIGTSRGATGATADIRNAVDFFNVDLDLFKEQLAELPAVAPVAWSAGLKAAAQGHTEKMIAFDSQSHQLPGELGLGARVSEAGYEGWRTLAENVFAFTEDAVQGHAAFYVDWGNTRTGIQDPAGHRVNILNGDFVDVGMSIIAETDAATRLGPWVVTQNFGARFDEVAQLVGVVLRDADGDDFYDAGEGLAGVRITATNAAGVSFATTSWGSGGYQMELARGTYDVVFSGGDLSGSVSKTVTVGNANVKLDAFAAEAFAVVTTLTGTTGNDWLTVAVNNGSVSGWGGTDMASFVNFAQAVSVNLEADTAQSAGNTITLNGIESVTGSIFGDYLQGDGGDNVLRGLGNFDWFVGSGGADVYEGGSGRDMVSYVFSDTGVTVNLGTQRGEAGLAAGDVYDSIERVTGSIHSDLLYGSDGEDDFRGLGGYDWFVGSGGGRDRYDGGSGLDTVSYVLSDAGVTASLLIGRGSGGDAARDLYTSIERLTGSSHADTLTGDHGRNELRGMFGDDFLFGNGGVDRLTGGGSDDYLDGGAGFDFAIFSENRSEYTITAWSGQTIVQYDGAGGDGTDTLVNIEALIFADDLVYL